MTNFQAATLMHELQGMLGRIKKREPIGENLAEIARLYGEISDTAPAQLAHFLERRSYAKALEFLQQGRVVEDAARPACDNEEDHP